MTPNSVPPPLAVRAFTTPPNPLNDRRLFLLGLAALTAGCAHRPETVAGRDGWHEVKLPGKTATHYAFVHKDGRPAIEARSEQSASMWRRRLGEGPLPRELRFSWWVQDLITDASVADVAREDAPARLLLAFDGDTSRLPPRTRAMFDLAEALTGERPPYATLMYVWDARAPLGSVVVNPRSDRIRKIVVDSGSTGLRSWRDHRRRVDEDFRLAFGEEPGRLAAVALMTDSDNTRSRARTWYGPVEFG